MAGGAARDQLGQAQAVRLAEALKGGYSDTALQAQTARMEPGALAVARRHDPFTVAGGAQRDREATLMAASLVRPSAAAANAAQPSHSQINVAAVRPFRMAADNPLDGARALECLSDAVYYEARGEGGSGQAAVAQVVLNRVRHPAFPKSVCGVVFQGAQSHACQFSFACNGAMRRPKEPGAWRRAQEVAARALGGFVMAEVGDATHFHVAGLGGIWGAGMMRVAQIGTHVFYEFARGARIRDASPAGVIYTAASEMADRPVYAERADRDTADGGAEDKPTLILAAAVTTSPAPPALGEGGPVGPVPEPASAPKPAPVAAKLPTASTDKPSPADPKAAS